MQRDNNLAPVFKEKICQSSEELSTNSIIMRRIEKHILAWHKLYPLNQNSQNNPKTRRKLWLFLPPALNSRARGCTDQKKAKLSSEPAKVINSLFSPHQQFYCYIHSETLFPKVLLSLKQRRLGYSIINAKFEVGKGIGLTSVWWVLGGRGRSAVFHTL